MAKPSKLKRPGSWFSVCAEWFDSPAYRDLSMPARCLLLEFQRIYLPSRNGQLSISVKNAMDRLGCAKHTAQGAFKELAEHGFIKLKEGERWQERKAREWALTIEPVNGHEPTDEWRYWRPKEPVSTLPKKKPLPPESAQKKPGSKCAPALGSGLGQAGLNRDPGSKITPFPQNRSSLKTMRYETS